MTYGPRKPPRFPMELMSAMLAAAAGPLRNTVGSAQNGDGKEYNAIVATEKARIANPTRFPAKTLTSSATPKSRIGTAAWSFRSDGRSECDADQSIAGSAASQGMPEIRITCVWLKPEMR